MSRFTDDQIKYMVDRFLMWKLPEHFNPDAGISFTPIFNHYAPGGPQKHQPVGTNLFDATQTDAMVRHMIEGLPTADQ
jgi:nicotinamide mononucleotide (NMN) deamidase PncC